MKNQSKPKSKYFPFHSAAAWRRLFGLALVCLLIPLLLLGFYSRPFADDCDYSLETHAVVSSGGGIVPLMGAALRTTVRFYNSWQGLYSSAFILSLQPGIFGEQFYFLTPWILIGGAFICLWFTFACIKKRLLSSSAPVKISPAFLALLGTVMIFSGMPSAAQGLYWFNGAMNYIPWCFAAIFNLVLLYEIHHISSLVKRVVLIGSSVVLSAVISGGAHPPAFAHILLLLIVTMFLIFKKRYYSIASLAAALAGFALMAAAPGTSIRQNLLNKSDAVSTIIHSAAQCLSYLQKWCNLSWVCILLLFTPFAVAVVRQCAGKFLYRSPAWLLILSYGVLCGMLCPSYYAMSGFGDTRLTNSVWVMFLALSLFDYVYLLGWLDRKTGILHKKNLQLEKLVPRNLFFAAVLCLAVIFLRSPSNVKSLSNSAEAFIELANGTAAGYASQRDAQLAILNDKSVRDAEIPGILIQPKLLFLSDMSQDPMEWPNTSCAQYYHKDSVKVVF